MMLVVGMCDWATATAIVIVLLLSVVVVMVMIGIVLDCCAECVLEDLGQDIFHVYWDITKGLFRIGEMMMEMIWGWMGGNGKRGTHAKVASVAPSITMGGAAPSDASQSSLTNEPHMRIISTGDRAMLTMPTSAFACSGF